MGESKLLRKFFRLSIVLAMVLLVGLAGHALFVSRGAVALTRRMGPAPTPVGVGEPFKFAVFADTHGFRGPIREAMTRAAEGGCSIALLVGDLVVRDDDHEYRYFCRRMAPLTTNLPLILTRGNHERMAPGGGSSDVWSNYIKTDFYTFEFGGSLFCLLDDVVGCITPAQARSIDERMSAFRRSHPAAPIFLFLHTPRSSLARPEPLGELAKKHRIRVVFHGHLHRYEKREMGDTRVIVTGGGGGSFRDPLQEEPHWVEVAVDRDRVVWKKMTLEGVDRWGDLAIYLLVVSLPRYRWYLSGGCGLALLLLLGVYRRFCRSELA